MRVDVVVLPSLFFVFVCDVILVFVSCRGDYTGEEFFNTLVLLSVFVSGRLHRSKKCSTLVLPSLNRFFEFY